MAEKDAAVWILFAANSFLRTIHVHGEERAKFLFWFLWQHAKNEGHDWRCEGIFLTLHDK